MSGLDRRELARLVGLWMASGAFAGLGRPASAGTEVDAPGGRQLMAALLGDDVERVIGGARTVKRVSRSARGRWVFGLPRRGRMVAELTVSTVRMTFWARRSGAVTLEGEPGAIRRVIAHPRRGLADPYDTAVATAAGVVLTTSAALVQRERAPHLVPGARLPAEYARVGGWLLKRIERAERMPRVEVGAERRRGRRKS